VSSGLKKLESGVKKLETGAKKESGVLESGVALENGVGLGQTGKTTSLRVYRV
jgi:X-X-X-Leu-X-X-Gly heptad repeat protein